jgi:hypothetical protein
MLKSPKTNQLELELVVAKSEIKLHVKILLVINRVSINASGTPMSIMRKDNTINIVQSIVHYIQLKITIFPHKSKPTSFASTRGGAINNFNAVII